MVDFLGDVLVSGGGIDGVGFVVMFQLATAICRLAKQLVDVFPL